MASLLTEEYPRQYWGVNLERFMKLKAEYDPENVFRHPQSVPLPT
jgi:FAD/FMN-containing dehydrogenase